MKVMLVMTYEGTVLILAVEVTVSSPSMRNRITLKIILPPTVSLAVFFRRILSSGVRDLFQQGREQT